MSTLGAALFGIGVSQDSIPQPETQVRNGKQLLLARGCAPRQGAPRSDRGELGDHPGRATDRRRRLSPPLSATNGSGRPTAETGRFTKHAPRAVLKNQGRCADPSRHRSGVAGKQDMIIVLFYSLRFEPILQDRVWGGRRLAEWPAAPSPREGPIGEDYGIGKLRDILGIAHEERIFVGDALSPGGNDDPAERAGVVSIRVRDPVETRRVIETIIACLG